ncbi:MAG: SDR family NAD(P)-dependent oxidoreductase, partial [Actinomycetota bacterium]
MIGNTAVVTGAGSGLGRAIAGRLAEDGWHVAVNDINPDTAERTAAAIADAGGSATAAVADVTDADAITALALRLDADRPIGALVFNATGPQPNIAFTDTDWGDVDDQLAFFARGPLNLTRTVAP